MPVTYNAYMQLGVDGLRGLHRLTFGRFIPGKIMLEQYAKVTDVSTLSQSEQVHTVNTRKIRRLKERLLKWTLASIFLRTYSPW